MKIAFIDVTATVSFGGIQTAIWELAIALTDAGHEVTVLGGIGPIQPNLRGRPVQILQFPFTPRERVLDLGNRFRRLWERWSMARHAKQTVIEHAFDWVILTKPFDFFWPYLMPKGQKTRFAFMSGGTSFIAGDRRLFRRISTSVACSHFNAWQIQKRYKQFPQVIFNGVDVELFTPQAASELRQSLQTLLADQQAAAQRQQAALAGQVAEAVASTLQRTLGEPLQRMSDAVEKLGSRQGATLGQALDGTLDRFTRHLDQTLGQRHDNIDSLLNRTAQTLNQIVGELGRLTTRLEASGSGALASATGQLHSAGSDVQRAGESLAGMGRDMAEAARAMNAAAQTASLAIGEQGRLQQAIAGMVGDLRTTVELARRDAGLTSELVGRLEQAATTLGAAQTRANNYLQSVNHVLAEAHDAFAGHVEQTLARGNQQFQRSVVSAVEALEGAIEELSDALNGERFAR